ncbi:MAG: carboxypeptidase regulatory-like domain-containing protein, partial [Bryobacteraceae bacterium]
TVPVGSRAQQYSAIADVPGVITFHSPKSSPNDWAPRIGFAYSPGKDGVWSIRGGVSRSFDNTYINLNQNASPAYYQTTADVDADHPVANFLANGGLQGAIAGANPTAEEARQGIAAYTFDQTRPYALTGTIGVQRLLGKDYTVEVRYVYTKGVHLWNQTQINKLSRVSATNNIPTFMSMPSAATLASLKTTLGDLQAPSNNSLAQYGFPNTITAYHPWGNSKYHGLQMQMNKRYSKNFSYIAAFTWSHAQDDSTATNFSTILSPRRAQDFNNMRAEWSDSALDRRLRFTFTPNYDFKPFQNGNWMLKNLIGNWNIALAYTYQSPEYATVQSGVDSNLNGDSAADRAIVNPAGMANTGSAVIAYDAAGAAVASDIPGSSLLPISRAPASTVAYVTANPNARYIEAGLGALANGGRNSFALAPINNFDFALMKRINFGEVKRFDIGAQFFNLFNHPQFAGGYIGDVSPYQTYAIDRSVFVPSSDQFGHYDEFFPSNARAIQIVARIVF